MTRRKIFGFIIIALCLAITYSQQCIDPNCQVCTNSTINVCSQCVIGYTLSKNSTCVECNITNCTDCSAPNNCVTCANQYTLLNNVCYECDIQNCLLCENNNYCIQCNQTVSPFVPSSVGDSCVLCNDSRCESCSSNNVCGQCINGLQLYVSTVNGTNTPLSSKCVFCQLYNCLACSSDNFCLNCAQGYQVRSDGQCFKCSFPCQTCYANRTCALCQTPFYAPNPDPINGTCVQNTVPHCANFSFDNTSNTYKCSNCQTNFLLNSTSQACEYQCALGCLNCSLTNNSQCSSCKDGYYLNNSQCLSCTDKGCKNCQSSSSCQLCFDGFYLQNSQCKKCPAYCNICKSANQCTQISDKKGGKAIFIDSSGVSVLAICPTTCKVCSNVKPQQCLICRQGYYLEVGVCKPCNSVCKTCDNKNPNICSSCFSYAVLVNSTCKTCDQNCLSCYIHNSSQCTSCRIGSYLSSIDNTCVVGCPDHCKYCSDSGTCTQCSSGYTLFFDTDTNQTICAQCLASCRTCSQGQPGNCLQCGDGMYLDDNQLCTSCADKNCKTCSQLGCQQCNNGYFQTQELTCALDCILPCATCLASNPLSCESCIAGYKYSPTSFSCIQITECTGPCTTCPLGYALISGKCQKCIVDNCQLCDSKNVSTCLSCLHGYYYDNSNNQCLSCVTGCTFCTSAQACLLCSDGYTNTPTSFTGTAGFNCLPCVGNCKTCQGGQNKCTSCIDQYQLKGWKCIKKFRFLFGLVLLTDKNTFYKSFIRFLKDLSKGFSGNNSTSATDTITLQSIKFGSVILAGSVDPSANSGDAGSTDQFQNLANKLGANNQLGGLTIGSSQLNVVGGTIAPQSSSNNLGLILGISIPIGTLLIVALIVLIVVKGSQIRHSPYNVNQRQGPEDAKQSSMNIHGYQNEVI